jgi:glycosyltransferase involved in cell wall biosynthesis
MNILFITPSYKPAYIYGGPTMSISELAENLVKLGHQVTVYTTTANGRNELEVTRGLPINLEGVEVYYFKRITGDHTHISPALWRKLNAHVKEFDLVHIQSWWSILVIGAAWICSVKKIRFVLSPRGMLGRYSFTNQHNISKKWIHRLIGRRLLNKSHLHATSNFEWKECKKLIPSWKGFVLPNLVQLPSGLSVGTREPGRKLTIGFLSRIDPKKGIELLMQALSEVNFDFNLQVAGKGEDNYVKTLHDLALSLNINDKIHWCGWKQGSEKFEFLEKLDLLVLTSYNENFANVVIESLSMGTAVLVSENVGLSDYINEKKLGWVTKPDPTLIRQTLEKIYTEREELKRIRAMASTSIKSDFSHHRLSVQYSDAYQSLIEDLKAPFSV